MKKILSVILILAALFGLVAGYMDLTDMLDCKSYWETKGDESAANLDALEAGLNTLKDNQKAYEDGLVTLADGEKAFEEGKANYEAGLAKYNAGIEEYDAGVIAYNNGMEQLAIGRGKVIDAKDKLSTYTDTQKKTAVAAAQKQEVQDAAAAVNVGAQGSTDAKVVDKAANAAAKAAVAQATGKTDTEIEYAVTKAQDQNVKALAAGVSNSLKGVDNPTDAQIAGAASAIDSAKGLPAGTTLSAYSAVAADTAVTKATKDMTDAYNATALAKGLKDYDKGYDDYMIAKGTLAWSEKKLAAAKEQLDAAKVELDAGKKTLDEAEKQLNEGRTSVKAYEDGVAQVKAGLAQVVATPADGGLVSIADRLGEGFKYTDGDKLLLDKGFEALAAAREYSAENGAQVTKEIASRAVGCILVLLAAVAGIVAGIVGILKGNKLGGLLAIVTCAAALIGVVVSYLAGSTFSAVAGSAGSTMLWIAGAAVAVMGLAAGIVGLAAKTPAKAE